MSGAERSSCGRRSVGALLALPCACLSSGGASPFARYRRASLLWRETAGFLGERRAGRSHSLRSPLVTYGRARTFRIFSSPHRRSAVAQIIEPRFIDVPS